MEPDDGVLADLLEATRRGIEEHGWMLQGVFATQEGETNTIYTVGLRERGFQELLVSGLPIEVGAHLLNKLAAQVLEAGFIPDVWQMSESVPVNLQAKILKGRSCCKPFSCGVLHRYYNDHALVAQMLWPNDDGHLPGDPQWDFPDWLQILQEEA